jgi:hypothetical protein
MKYLKQSLNTKDDSFSYTLMGETTPLYKVDSSGYLTEEGKQIGKFKLGDNQWHLHLDGELFMSGPPNGLFYLPEFELKALTALVNLD